MKLDIKAGAEGNLPVQEKIHLKNVEEKMNNLNAKMTKEWQNHLKM